MNYIFQPYLLTYSAIFIHLLHVTSVLCEIKANDDGLTHPRSRQIRSNCGNSACDVSFVTNYQTFHSPVVFNSHFPANGCGSGRSCNSTDNIPPQGEVKPKFQSKMFTETFKLPKRALDLYWLMDATGSFQKTRELLETQAGTYIDAIKNLKSIDGDFTVGYGTFTDKYGTPTKRRKRAVQGSTVAAKGRSSASGRVINYSAAEPFRSHGLYNILSLKNIDATEFSKMVGKGLPGIQSGRSEDLLTGLHQLVTCPVINWRENARRLLLVTTDQRYYAAGIKKFVGKKDAKESSTSIAVIPFDGACHLDGSGFFTGDEYNKYDYPSTDQVKIPLREKGITIIFAIGQTEDKDWDNGTLPISIFDEYANTYAPALTQNAILYPINVNKSTAIPVEDIIAIIKGAFDQIKDNEILQTYFTPESKDSGVTVKATCITNRGDKDEVCKVTEEDKEVTFKINVTVPCPWTDNVTLEVNLRGRTEPPRKLDLSTICQ